MDKSKRDGFVSIVAIIALVGVLNIYAGTSANAANSGLNMSATIEPSSTVTIDVNAVALDIVPSADGTFKSNYVTVSAYTNTTNTCNVTMTTSSSALTSGANSIPSLTSAVSESDFSVNSWGYRAGSSGDYNPVATGEAANPIATLTSITGSNAITTDVYFAAKLNQAIKPGTYTNTVTFASTCPPSTIMQEQTAGSLAVLMPNVGDTATLTDSRDGNEYNVIRINSGKYIMASNLNLAGGTKLDSAGSNVPAGYTQSNPYYTLPASTAITSGTDVSSDQFSDNTQAYVFNTGNNTTNCKLSAPCNSYYSWLAATAGGKDSSGNTITSNGYNAAYSVCPKGWKLPSATTSNASATTSPNWKTGDWYTIITAFGGNLESSYSESAGTFHNNAGPGTDANFLLAGRYSVGSFLSGGYNGNYWSSTTYSDTTAYYIEFTSSYVNSADSNYRRNGCSVRCMFDS